ncbi:MAG: hypothetical protein ABUT20_29635, partial [Bacteroidota bacterium]
SYKGMSWSMYNPKTAEWQQTWVDNKGGYIVLTGKFINGEMTLSTQPMVTPKGNKIVSRMVFYHIKPDSFDWNWENTSDEGKTWKLNWQIHYQRRK